MPLVLSMPFHRGLVSEDEAVRKKATRWYLFLVGTVLFLFMGLRSRYLGSTDTRGYYGMMEDALRAARWDQFFDPDGVETGFQRFLYALSRVFSEPQMVIVVSSAIYVATLLVFVRRNSRDMPFAITMYITLGLMTFDMQGMRQAIAMSICMIAYEVAKKKGIRPLIVFVLLVLLAMQFHRTAVVFFVVYFLMRLPYHALNILLILAGSGVFLMLSDRIVALGNALFDREYNQAVESGGYVATLICFLIIFAALLAHKGLTKDKRESGLLYITVLGAACYVMRYAGTSMVERISFYFTFAQLALLPNTLSYLKGKERTAAKVIVYTLMIALFLYRLRGSGFLPYELCFSD